MKDVPRAVSFFFLFAEVSLAFLVLLRGKNAWCHCIYKEARCARQGDFSKTSTDEMVLHSILSGLIVPLLCILAHKENRRDDGSCP